MIGSFGYSAPEFALSGIYTLKSDVYSFGVVMLELLTGRKPLDRYVWFHIPDDGVVLLNIFSGVSYLFFQSIYFYVQFKSEIGTVTC